MESSCDTRTSSRTVTCNSSIKFFISLSSVSFDEMVLAKKVLWAVGGVELLGKNINRTDSEYRTKVFILCTDVIEGMQKLDQCGRPMPTFLWDANGVGRLPTFSPEDYNVVSLDERCRKLERLMMSLQ